MRLFWKAFYDRREARRQRRRARGAFRDYARNGWQSPWMRKNSFWSALRQR